MKKLLPPLILSTLSISSAIASPTLQELPKQQPGKAAFMIYSSTLRATSTYDYYVNNEKVGTIEGDKVKLIYLEPGEYKVNVNVPYSSAPLTKTVNVTAGKYYFMNAYTTLSGKHTMLTTYHLENVEENAALAYLQNSNKNSLKWYEITL